MLVRGDAQRLEVTPQDSDDLGVGCRRARAETLDADLPELPHAAFLGTFVPEHRTRVIELGLRPVGCEIVLKHRAHHACGALRAQRDGTAALSLKVYISLDTMSVASPIPRVNTSVCSKSGVYTGS